MQESEIKRIARYVNLREVDVTANDVLLVGGGGREHAIACKLMESARVGCVYGAPGNDGMGIIPTGLGAVEIDKIVEYVATHDNIKLTVVAPDDPLGMGLVDRLNERGFRAFGPTRAAARLEWSKSYAKDVMRRYAIPTALYGAFTELAAAKEYVKRGKTPIVVKADGLALGKGVVICQTKDEAYRVLEEMLVNGKLGAAGNSVVIEEFLTGYELSLLAFCDGEHYSLMPTSCDHKRALDGNKGPNTGGMGAYSPCPTFTKELAEKTKKTIVEPTLAAMKKEGAPFKGVLYFGLMVSGDEVRVLEYNARFGDPETQCILPLLESDLYEIMNATIDGTLDKIEIKWSDKKSINVVLASGGYPLAYKKGCAISGLENIDADVNVFFAGVVDDGNGLATSGGRVLCVQASSDDFVAARKAVYDNIARVTFDGCFYRKDIGEKLCR